MPDPTVRIIIGAKTILRRAAIIEAAALTL